MQRHLLLLALCVSAVAPASAQQGWLAQARQRVGLQLPPQPGNPAVLVYRQPLRWPLRATQTSVASASVYALQASYHYAIPREAFLTEEAFRRYYLDNPQLVRQRMPAPPLTEVPELHRPQRPFDLCISF